MRSIPKIGLLVLLTGSFLFLSCGDDSRRYAMVAYRPAMVPTYGNSYAPVARRYVRIHPRQHAYGYAYPYNRYYRWRSGPALQAYVGCRAPRYMKAYWGRYNCGFPYQYRYYEAVSRYLDSAVEECWHGRRNQCGRYLSQAQNALPGDDPIAEQVEEIQDLLASADSEELQDLMMETLGEVALKLPERSSNN